MTPELIALLSAQYAHEIRNSLTYRAFTAWAEFRGLIGTAKFLAAQADGELEHAAKVYRYILSRNVEPVLTAFSATYQGPVPDLYRSVFEAAYKLEQDTTASLIEIGDKADALTTAWLATGLLLEQIEEENTIKTILDRIDARSGDVGLVGGDVQAAPDHGAIIHDVDVWLGARA